MLRWRRQSLFFAPLLVFAAVLSASAEQPEPVAPVTDWRTGLALYGFDPVAYFAEGRAVEGVAEHEERFAGAAWRFKNAGNQAAFIADPMTYAPAFGGYDPNSVGRGTALPGHPHIWAIHEGQLFFFETERSRNAFRLDPKEALDAAAQRWAAVSAQL